MSNSLFMSDWWQERLKAKREGGGRKWAGKMASPTQWTWIGANSGGDSGGQETGGLQSMGLQSVRQVSATEQKQTTTETSPKSQIFRNW